MSYPVTLPSVIPAKVELVTVVSDEAPITNLFLKSGVPFEPLHRTKPVGILDIKPDQATMTPLGIEALVPAVPC